MPAVPPTPFVLSRLGDGYGEESLLMAQEPIFEDQSFADNTFWTSTPRPDRRARKRSLSVDTPDITISKGSEVEEESHDDASNTMAGLGMEETEYSGRGERRTWLDEGTSEASSSRSKRGVSSPGNMSESKRARPRSPHRDDYYHRRLSRNGSSTSLASPSLPTICLSSSSSSASGSRQLSTSSTGSKLSNARAPSVSQSLLRVEVPPSSTLSEPEISDSRSPRPAPSRLSKFLARSSILHPPKPPNIDHASFSDSHHDPPQNAQALSLSDRELVDLPSFTNSRNDAGDNESDTAPSLPSISRASLPPTPSLRKSTSQRVLGFLSDLVRSTSSSILNTSVACEKDDAGNFSGVSAGKQNDRSETDGEHERCGDQSVKSREQSFASATDHPPSGHASSTSEHDHSRISSGSHTSHRTTSRPTTRQPPGFVSLTRPKKAFISNTASRASNPIRNPNPSTTSSSFTSAALARLPPSGKGSSSSGERITIKPTERATNLKARRALFEHPSNDQTHTQAQPPPQPRAPMKRTIPLAGRTPGKASKARAEARQRFDRAVHERMEGKEQMHVDTERRKREQEEREYMERRKETVIRAKPVPEMYKRRRGGD